MGHKSPETGTPRPIPPLGGSFGQPDPLDPLSTAPSGFPRAPVRWRRTDMSVSSPASSATAISRPPSPPVCRCSVRKSSPGDRTRELRPSRWSPGMIGARQAIVSGSLPGFRTRASRGAPPGDSGWPGRMMDPASRRSSAGKTRGAFGPLGKPRGRSRAACMSTRRSGAAFASAPRANEGP